MYFFISVNYKKSVMYQSVPILCKVYFKNIFFINTMRRLAILWTMRLCNVCCNLTRSMLEFLEYPGTVTQLTPLTFLHSLLRMSLCKCVFGNEDLLYRHLNFNFTEINHFRKLQLNSVYFLQIHVSKPSVFPKIAFWNTLERISKYYCMHIIMSHPMMCQHLSSF